MSELVFAAFQALGMSATKRDVARVAKALRASADADVFALFGEPDPDAPFDREACAAVAEIAERAGAGGLVALDLYTEFLRPGWSPFPACGAADGWPSPNSTPAGHERALPPLHAAVDGIGRSPLSLFVQGRAAGPSPGSVLLVT